MPLLWEARLLIAEGKLARAERLILDVVRANGDDPAVRTVFGTQALFVRYWQGRFDEMLQMLDRGGITSPVQLDPYLTTLRILPLVRSRRSENARRHASRLIEKQIAKLPAAGTWHRPVVLALLACAISEIDDDTHAELIRQQLEPWEELELQVATPIALGPCRFYLGMLDRVSKQFDRAIDQLEQAVVAAEWNRLELWQLLANTEVARALAARGRFGDAARAARINAEVTNDARRLGIAV
jgi:hypothetical protein